MSTTLTETPAQLLKLHPKDNVAVALKPLAAKTTLAFEGQTITLFEDIPQGHKIALKDLAQSQDVIKYGYPIGHLLANVKTGQWLHTHNVKTNLSGTLAYTYAPDLHPVRYPKGLRRSKGTVGRMAKLGFGMIY